VKRTAATDAHVDTVGYRRVSKGEQAAEWKASLRQQTEAETALAEKLGRTLDPAFIWEDRFSGEDAESREGFMALIAFCRAHPRKKARPGYALFLNDSRFGRFRDPDEAAYWRFELQKCGWIARFAENDETQHPTTRHMMRAIGGAQASEYLAKLRENAKRGAAGAAAAGLWQNEAPFGYRRLATASGRAPVVLEIGQRKSDDQQVRLTPGPKDEVGLVRWAFETYADGLLSVGKLAQEMRRKAPRLKWSKQNLAKMLANEAYLGHVIWGRRPHDKEERKEVTVRPESEWTICRDAHEPLVTQELFDRVRDRLALNRRQTRAAAGAYPLSGLIRCTHCGKHYAGGGGPRGPADDPERYRIYRCTGSHDDNRVCPGRIGTIQKRVIEPIVIGLVSEIVSAPEVQLMIREEIEAYLAARHGSSDEEKAALRARGEALGREKANLVDAIAAGVLAHDDARPKMERIRLGQEEVEHALQRLDAMAEVERDLERHADRLATLAGDFAARARELRGPALRELLAPWIEEAWFDKATRVLELTVRRVPQLPVVATPEQPLQPGARGVRARIAFPGHERDARGRYRTPTYKIAVAVTIESTDRREERRVHIDQYAA
jgi:DNA invertase Pin-like site-specific DNA recombinase